MLCPAGHATLRSGWVVAGSRTVQFCSAMIQGFGCRAKSSKIAVIHPVAILSRIELVEELIVRFTIISGTGFVNQEIGKLFCVVLYAATHTAIQQIRGG